MIISKFAKQNMDRLKITHPDLYHTIQKEFSNLEEKEQGKIAGLVIEYVLKCGGDSNVLIEDDDYIKQEDSFDEAFNAENF